MSENDLFVNPCLIVRVRYAPSADSAHSENRIKNEELEGVLAQYPSIQEIPKKIIMKRILPIIYFQLISSVIIDIHVMLFAGFGFLMTFLKNYGYSAISFTVMITVIITEFGILCFGISRFEDGDYTIKITMIE